VTVSPLRWGIIGPGKIARKFAQAMTVVEDGVLYAVASRDQERAEAFSTEFGARVAYGAYEQIADDPEVDAIYVSTPHRFHFENAMLCLQAGKPVLCEKPLTVTSREAEVLFQTAQAKAIFFMEALWSRYLPIYQVVREWLDKDLIGEPRLVSSTFGIIGNPDPEWRMFNANLAGGALLDLGVYNISISQWVLRKNPVSFLAQGIIGATNVDELTSSHVTSSLKIRMICLCMEPTDISTSTLASGPRRVPHYG
jgi:dihydrodiol dehydrogenase / D-xylose 1-dehydrogenase (NADP)